METVKLEEFDVFTREDLISEILAMRGKYIEEVAKSVLENTAKERDRLLDVENKYVEATHDYVSKELEDLISLYEESKANRDKKLDFCFNYGWEMDYRISFCIAKMKSLIRAHKPENSSPSSVTDFTARVKDENARLGFIKSMIEIFKVKK